MILERLFSDVSPDVARILDAALDGRELGTADAAVLLRAEGADLYALMRAADVARREDSGDDVSFVVNRNINFTNVCYVGCSFCGFSRHKDDEDVFDHGMEILVEKARNAVERGATEVCIQGGIHPNKDHTHYRDILVAVKREFPDLHIHAYSPEEIDFGHTQERHGAPRLPALAGGRGSRNHARHRGRDPRRRDPRRSSPPSKLEDRPLGRDHRSRPRRRACARRAR